MSKYTVAEVQEMASVLLDNPRPREWKTRAGNMLRSYAATLEQQAEWPSDEECRTVLASLPLGAAHTPIEMVRAALQSVRPPATQSTPKDKPHDQD